jgi:hypothetical protein
MRAQASIISINSRQQLEFGHGLIGLQERLFLLCVHRPRTLPLPLPSPPILESCPSFNDHMSTIPAKPRLFHSRQEFGAIRSISDPGGTSRALTFAGKGLKLQVFTHDGKEGLRD